MKKLTTAAFALLFTVCAVSSSYAIAGIGFHWGLDFSMDMKDNSKDVVYSVDDFLRDIGSAENPFEQAGINLTNDDAFLYISRTNWRSSPVNFGGKAYIDIIPVIDAIEISCNFGLWQYDGMINYLSIDNGAKIHKPVLLGLDNVDLDYFSLGGTPYAKLQLDATIRKKLYALPANVVKFSAGAGASVHFATPLLSSKLINDVLSARHEFDMTGLASGSVEFDENTSKAIVQKVIDGLAKPAFGMHLIVGAQFKLPVIPVGFYVDGKFMIPFTEFEDSDAGKDLDGLGFLINAGISLSF